MIIITLWRVLIEKFQKDVCAYFSQYFCEMVKYYLVLFIYLFIYQVDKAAIIDLPSTMKNESFSVLQFLLYLQGNLLVLSSFQLPNRQGFKIWTSENNTRNMYFFVLFCKKYKCKQISLKNNYFNCPTFISAEKWQTK